MPEQWAPSHLKRLAERLDLKPEQQEELRPIIKRNMDELNHLRSKSLAETKIIFERMEREVSEKLTPEQRVKFEKQNQEFRDRIKRFGADRLGGPRGERGTPERPPGAQPPPDKPAGQ
jgi:Skp family chaperone for outer membrane proteins